MGEASYGCFKFARHEDWIYAVNIVETVAWLAGTPDYLDDLRETIDSLRLFDAGERRRSGRLFEWLAMMLSYQGISDVVAEAYMAEYGRPRWVGIAHGVKAGSCPRLNSYWHFHGCGYRKSTTTCAMPHLIDACPLPSHRFRNGNLSQLAYSLFLFIRDIANGDLIGWIDARLAEAEPGPADGRIGRMQAAILGPLASVHGASNKVLSMALSDLLVACNGHRPAWGQVGGGLIAVDTLVHNFLVRTGILARARANHRYGPQCYEPRGCAALLSRLSEAIDARQFNSEFPQFFPRYIQRAIWGYCAANGLNVCNGNTINDDLRCQNRDCRLFANCDRRKLTNRPPKSSNLRDF
jgi:hypothetical protein